MQPFTREDLQLLLSEHKPPCVSLCVPTRRAPAEWHQNALTFKNLLREAEKAVQQKKEWKQAAGDLIGKLAALDNQEFWTKQRDTLAVFASPDSFHWWQFGEAMPAEAVVGETFHTKGLVKLLQGEVRYYVLALTKENISLFEGNRETLDVVNVPGMPRGLRDVDTKQFESSLSAKTTAPGAGGGTVMFGSGRDSLTNEHKEELKALFRTVDRALFHVTHDQRAPLILATFDQHHGMFHEVSKNPALLDERIEGDPDKMSLDDIRKRAVALLKPRREKALKEIAATYGTAAAHHRGTNYLPNISKAAVYGRVQALLIEDGRRIGGTLDRKSGEITGMSSSPQADGQDLLDDVSELVLAAGGNVYVLPKALMPTDVGVAAIYRY
jgi:Bacterial archaeo-eukaryotic release factor family 3